MLDRYSHVRSAYGKSYYKDLTLKLSVVHFIIATNDVS